MFNLGLNSEADILLPFANDRGGTIKYKTNPALAYQQLQVVLCFFLLFSVKF